MKLQGAEHLASPPPRTWLPNIPVHGGGTVRSSTRGKDRDKDEPPQHSAGRQDNAEPRHDTHASSCVVMSET